MKLLRFCFVVNWLWIPVTSMPLNWHVAFLLGIPSNCSPKCVSQSWETSAHTTTNSPPSFLESLSLILCLRITHTGTGASPQNFLRHPQGCQAKERHHLTKLHRANVFPSCWILWLVSLLDSHRLYNWFWFCEVHGVHNLWTSCLRMYYCLLLVFVRWFHWEL